MNRTTFSTSAPLTAHLLTSRRLRANGSVGLLCLVSVLAAACNSESVVALRYTYSGCAGDGTTNLVVKVTAAGRMLSTAELPPPGPGTQSVPLKLPSDLSGTIGVNVESRNADGCLVASGNAQVDLSVKRDANNPADDIEVTLSCLSTPDCAKTGVLDPTIQPALLWSMRCGSDGDDVGTGTAFDQQGNVYVVGSLSGRAAGPACTYTNSAGDPNRHLAKLTGGSFLIKLSPEGVVQWSRTLGGVAGSAPNLVFDVRQPRLAVTPGGEVLLAGVATQNARLETATANLADGPFVARYNSSGNLSWQRSFGSVSSGTTWTRIGAVTTGDRNGQPVFAVAGDCVGTTLVMQDDCKAPKQFVMYFEGAERLNNITAKMFGDAVPQAPSVFKYSITSVALSATGRTVLTGSNQKNSISEGDSGVSPQLMDIASMYVMRGRADGVWTGGFHFEKTQPNEFDANNPGELLPYFLEKQPNHILTSTVDRQDNLYVAGSFYNNTKQPRIQKFSPNATVADWTSEMTTQDVSAGTHGLPTALSLDNDDNPILVFSYSKQWTLGDLVQVNAPNAGGHVSDLAIIKYSKSYNNGTGANFLWGSPLRITLGNHLIFDFSSHKATNRMSLVSRTKNSSILLDDVPLSLQGPGGKAGKYDLVLLVMGPPGR